MFLLRLYNVNMTIEKISTIFNSIYKRKLFKISKFYRMKLYATLALSYPIPCSISIPSGNVRKAAV